uniref:Uncharacterized protein n=1 Tax=Manihot esculenta TaxID=3983 RepID=A0A2C9VNV8_MANES
MTTSCPNIKINDRKQISKHLLHQNDFFFWHTSSHVLVYFLGRATD